MTKSLALTCVAIILGLGATGIFVYQGKQFELKVQEMQQHTLESEFNHNIDLARDETSTACNPRFIKAVRPPKGLNKETVYVIAGQIVTSDEDFDNFEMHPAQGIPQVGIARKDAHPAIVVWKHSCP